MIGDNVKGVIANARRMTWPTRMMVSLTGSAYEFMDTPDTNPYIVSTYGTYHLVYNTKTRNGEDNVKRFALVFDFGKQYLKCSNFDELERQADTNDLARFFLKYTNICPDIFRIAMQNESMHIPVCLDVVKYNKDIRKQLGIEDLEEYAMVFNPFKPTHGSRWKVDEREKIYYTDLDRPDIRIESGKGDSVDENIRLLK